MENYIVSARKYRPQTFESVVGQKALTETLRNAILSGHLAHAYLFCGPRGVGKTTCARIFAKTINCLNPTETKDACNECESCVAFNEQRSFNIHELDAASNNSVDDIRALIEQVRIPPQLGKYSVYIIDEVHMLSSGAFNALLKTLEEPPSYAIFILATTEKHKVLPTILSRCQVYDFARITIQDIIQYLQFVAKQEGITASEEALNVVAQKADGGMRDALSIFDQLVAFCGNEITYENVIEVLNVLDSDYYFQVVDKALQKDTKGLLLLLNEILQKGFDAGNFVNGLAKHVRDVLVSKDPSTIALLEVPETMQKRYAQQAQQSTDSWLYTVLDLLNTCDIQYRTAKNKRLLVELTLIKIANIGTQPTTPPTTSPTKGKPSDKPSTTSDKASNLPPMPSVTLPTTQAQPASDTSTPISPQPQPKPQASQATSDKAPANAPFTNDHLKTAWETVIENFKSEQRIYAILSSIVPQKSHSDEISCEVILPLTNAWQQNILQTLFDNLKNQLQDILHNENITLHHQIIEVQNTVQAYTEKGKCKALIEENPLFETFMERFKLAIE